MITVVSPLSAFVITIFSFLFKSRNALSALERLGLGGSISTFDRSNLIASKLQSINLFDLLGRLNLFLYLSHKLVKASSSLRRVTLSGVGTNERPFLSSEASAVESTCFDRLSTCTVTHPVAFER